MKRNVNGCVGVAVCQLPAPSPCRPGSTGSGSKNEEKTKSTLSHSLFGSGSHEDTGDLFSPKDKTVGNRPLLGLCLEYGVDQVLLCCSISLYCSLSLCDSLRCLQWPPSQPLIRSQTCLTRKEMERKTILLELHPKRSEYIAIQCLSFG